MTSARWLVLVNHVEDQDPAQMTSVLVASAVTLGIDVWVAGAADLELADNGQVDAQARPVRGIRTAEQVPDALTARAERVDLASFDRVVVRTNPARDPRAWAHAFALLALERAERAGVCVINGTEGLRRYGTKPGCLAFPPAIRPRTRITRSTAAIRDFAQGGRCVVKPASGTHGRGVFVVHPDDPNLGAAAELLAAEGMVVVQEWLPEAVDGDVRLFVVDGEVFRVGGHPAVVRRRPARGELRSNVHLGGVPEATDLDAALQAVADGAGPLLAEAGVRVAGLDVIGGRIVECNVFSPGGLQACADLYGVDFVGGLVDRVSSSAPAGRT